MIAPKDFSLNSCPKKQIQLLLPDMPSAAALVPYLQRIDNARWYTNFGPLASELESRLVANHVATEGTLKAQTVANATLGIELALACLNIPAHGRILVPAVTFTATISAVVRNGCVPLITDVDRDSWLLTPAIARRVVENTQLDAVIPVCAYGCPQEPAEWDRFESETGVRVVIDAAGAFGNQKLIGRSCVVFSLHATKNLGAGEGGFVISNDHSRIAEIRRLSNFGINLSTGRVESAGTNAKLSEYHAAVALACLDYWPARRGRRIALHQHYLATLAHHCPDVILQRRPAEGAYTIMPVLLPAGRSAEAVAKRLATRGIGTRRWYCPIANKHPAYQAFPTVESLEMATEINERLVGLPFYPDLSTQEVDYVCHELKAAYRT